MVESDQIKKVIKFVISNNKNYSIGSIEFTPYCEEKLFLRGVSKEEVLKTIEEGKDLYYAQIQNVVHKGINEERYKAVYKISSKYSLIIVIAYSVSVLKIVNVIKTSKTAEKLWRKKASL